ncbi:MAG: hypothetical protein H8E19_15695 [Deltaproteobacteria bacterium]|uniref:Uncharacterized protein n=1 Tax=Candidatus Desulfacyla euxinica TaxID=2841693 RepID=A0A8J6N0Z1_9DELT|nr:hypothetical protein [Candidatus Desulfacyla euxinica]
MKKLTHSFLITAPLWILFLAFENFYLISEAIPFDSNKTAFQGALRISSKTRPAQNKSPELQLNKLTPAQQYAGEILAYLLQIVLGQAGRSGSREDWKIRGIDEELDFRNIVEVMTDPERDQLDLMVLDPNILDLTRTLYYYDEKLSLYKGDFGVASIYPAPEFIAIRLLLLQKIHRTEKINLKALIDREALLLDPELKPSPRDLNAMNLKPAELKLIRDIIESEPRIYQYLKSPFLVKAFYDTGAIEGEKFVKQGIREAGYKRYQCSRFGGSDKLDALKILFLPSIMREFYYGDSNRGLSQHGFKPTEFFDEMTKKLEKEILAATKTRLRKEVIRLKGDKPEISVSQWDRLWNRIAEENISFYIEDERPLVIYPENAGKTIRDVCPEADFTVILLGKNIYKSILFDKIRDVYPAVDRLYVDIMDIKHSETEDETEKISEFICSKLRDRIRGMIRKVKP